MAHVRSVFISHAHADNALCDQYVSGLRSRGLDVWYDRTNMQDGHFLSTDIEHELRTRSAFVVLLTPASISSYWVNLEVSAFRTLAAHDPERIMLPVRIAQCDVPLLMAGIKWVDALSTGFEPAIDAIAAAVGGLSSGAGRTPTYSTASALAGTTTQTHEAACDLVVQAKAFIAQGRASEAMSLLERATFLDPQNSDAWANLGRAYNGEGRSQDSIAACDRALTLDPGSGLAWYAKGIALAALGRHNHALAAYDQALDLDPSLAPLCWNNKGSALIAMRRLKDALAAYDQALALHPAYASAWHNRSVVLRALGADSEAKQSEKRAKSLGWPGNAH